MKFIGIIPARYESSRFPGKPLFLIDGKSMIQRVYEQVSKSTTLTEIVVATDDLSIENHVKKFGGNVIMTSKDHLCGTDRCYEAFEKMNFNNKYNSNDIVINIQGDEPCINPEQIDLVANCFNKEEVKIATLIKKIDTEEDIYNSTIIKVVCDQFNRAIYFSRSPIPFIRDKKSSKWMEENPCFQHIGIYAYRASILGEITHLKPSPLEKSESLEQLRWLENGYPIHVNITTHKSYSVDVPADITKILALLKETKK